MLADLLQERNLHNQMVESIMRATGDANVSINSLIEGMESLKNTVESVEGQMHGFWASQISWRRITTLVLTFFMLFLLKSGSIMPWTIGVFSGLSGAGFNTSSGLVLI